MGKSNTAVEEQEAVEEFDEEQVFGVDDELDLSNESTIEAKRVDLTITEVDVVDTENGQRAHVTFESDEVPFPITLREWLKHKNPKAQSIGRGNIKRLFKAVYGAPKGSLEGLQGRQVSGYVREDNDGFAKVGSFQRVKEEAGEAVEL